MPKVVQDSSFSKRLKFISLFFIIIASVCIGRLFYLQVIEGENYKSVAQSLVNFQEIIIPLRGEIYANNNDSLGLNLIATNKKVYNVILNTYKLEDNLKEKLADDIAQILNLPKEDILKKLNLVNDPYIKLKNNVSEEEAQKIRALKSPHLYIENDWQRYYPLGEISAKSIGFLGFDKDKKVGRYGLEQRYEDTLKGIDGFIFGQKDATGRLIPIAPVIQKGGVDGSSLITSIDTNVAKKSYEIAKELVEKWQAQKSLVVIVNPLDGSILSSEEFPSYDPNSYNLVKDQTIFLNELAQKAFEPGSIFKPITMAIALEKKLIEPDTTYNDTGQVKIGKYIIKNSTLKSYGIQTMTQVLEKSLNTGAVFVQKLIGNNNFKDFVKKFGRRY